MALNLTPNIGPWSPKITRIMKMWIQPCDVNPFIWVTAYIAQSPTIAFSILAPDCLDYTADRFRMSPRKRRKGTMNMADFAKPITPGNSGIGTWMFTALAMAQRIGWYFLLIDATADWVIAGTSTAYQWTGCQDPNAGYASVSMDNKVPALLPPATFIITQWNVDSAHLFSAGPTGVGSPRGHSVGVGFSLTQNRGNFPPLPDCDWTAELIDTNGRSISGELSPIQEDGGNQSVTYFNNAAGFAADSHNFIVVVTKTFGVFQVSGHMSISGTNLEGIAKSGCGHTLKGGF